ncbi:MAG: L-lactate permease [Fimbriimonadaceae bacterium]
MKVLLASLPILVVLGLMLGLRWPAFRAGMVGAAAALLVAGWGFGFGVEVLPQFGFVGAASGAALEAGFLAATILWIIFPALCIHELQTRTGALDRLKASMARVTDDPRLLALVVAWFFALFMEGAAGFGTSAALAAPFLLAAGFSPVQAVTIALVGHAVGVSFGAVGTPILPQAASTGLAGGDIAAETAAYHLILGWIMPLLVVWLAPRPASGSMGLPLLWGLGAGAAFLLPMYGIARFVGPELPTLGGSLVGGALFVAILLGRRRRPQAGPPASDASAVPRGGVARAGLVAAVLATRLVEPVRSVLGGIQIAWNIEPFSGSFAPLFHPGTMLLIGFFAGAAAQSATRGQIVGAMRAAARRLGPVTIALFAMLTLSRVMVYAGMIDTLAAASADAAGTAWPLLAPFVGALGTFVTGSATASNVLFTDFQVATAERLGLPVLPLVAAQGFGAAVGNIVCPHNVIAAGATVALAGRESDVLAKTLLPALAYAALGGLLAFAFFTVG